MEALLQDIKEIKIKPNDIRFLIGILAAIAIFFTRQHYIVFIALFTITGLLFPKAFTPLYRVWMTISICIGFVMSSILFSVVYFLGFTIIGQLMKLFNQEPLDLSWKSSRETYWEKKKKTVTSYEKQY